MSVSEKIRAELIKLHSNRCPWPVKILLPQWQVEHYVGLGYPRDMFEVEPELPRELDGV